MFSVVFIWKTISQFNCESSRAIPTGAFRHDRCDANPGPPRRCVDLSVADVRAPSVILSALGRGSPDTQPEQ